MGILKYFIRSNKPSYILYKLKDGQWDNLLNQLPDNFRQCYITDEALEDLSIKRGVTKSEFLENYIVPDVPIIKSGDFGEMLCYYAVVENFKTKGVNLFAPQKWQWKDDRNKAAPGSDGVFFHRVNKTKPDKDDLMITIESKMKAAKSNSNRLQRAITDANKDKNTRMAKTLSWLEEKYARKGNEDSRSYVERFKDPAFYGGFKKQYKAIAIIDSNFLTHQQSCDINNDEGIIAIIFSISQLKKMYEDSRIKIIGSI